MSLRPRAVAAPRQPRPGIGRLSIKERFLTAARRVNLGLLAITVGGALFGAYWTVKVSQWAVMSDELQYTKLGLSIGDTLSPIPYIRDTYTGSLAQLYPLLIAPFMRLLDMPTAFRTLHIFNSVLMASTAIPAYLLTLEVVRSRLAAYLVAALTVTVPWIVMSSMLLTETAAYPAFVWALLALQRSLDRPGTTTDLLALAGLAVAFLARTQFLLLAPVFAIAVVLHEVGYAAVSERAGVAAATGKGLRNIYAGHRLLVWASAAALVVSIPAALAGSLGKVLGRYETTLSTGDFLPHGILHAVALHVDFMALGVAVVPFVLGTAWAVGSIVRPSSKAGHAFALLAVLTVVALAFESSSFNLRFAAGAPVQDRYVFYVVPLLFVAMAACLLDARRRSVAVMLSGVAFAWLLSQTSWGPSKLPFFASPDSVFHRVLVGRSWELGHTVGLDLSAKTLFVIGTLSLSATVAIAMRRLAPRTTLMAVGLPVLVYLALETNYVFKQVTPYINAGPPTSLKGRDWVDQAVPSGTDVGVIVAPVNSNWDGAPLVVIPGTVEATWLDTEFWNKSIDRVYLYTSYANYAPFKFLDLSLDYRTGRLSLPEARSYLVVSASDIRFAVAASWRQDSISGLALIKPSIPRHVVWATRNLEPPGRFVPGQPPARLRLYPTGRDRAYRVSIIFQSEIMRERTRHFRVRLGGDTTAGTVQPERRRVAVLNACVPANRPLDGSAHGQVGLRITRIMARPLNRRCSAAG